ncbi:hypothetical protein CcCBS67573_g10051 [Chytriomyces confervae]|uniref:S1-like domain-containing protein n=1 Tax=Chytriomyces confervae TaxID=246404 RepID=A0A507DHU9_9FUNG|nr:hypothetical protein CcCBS67573_g10051 [Chytriomyces confervae]
MGIRKIAREVNDTSKTPTPETPLQRYGRVTGIRGGGLYDALVMDEALDSAPRTALLQLPSKFKKVIFVKLGSYILAELYPDAATKVHGDILCVVRPEHLKLLKAENRWPAILEPAKEEDDDDEDSEAHESGHDSDGDSMPDIFVNRNRMHVEEQSEDEED